MGKRLQMQTCEDYVDLSFMNESKADVTSESVCNTKVGMVWNRLQDRRTEYMMVHYCEEDPAEQTPRNTNPQTTHANIKTRERQHANSQTQKTFLGNHL